ncbi:MAG: hypothetical protein Q620_VSAC01210G0001, partial [Veillonella sp. DORA_A_3_16_22]
RNNSGYKFAEIWPFIIPPFTGQTVKGVFFMRDGYEFKR